MKSWMWAASAAVLSIATGCASQRGGSDSMSTGPYGPIHPWAADMPAKPKPAPVAVAPAPAPAPVFTPPPAPAPAPVMAPPPAPTPSGIGTRPRRPARG